MTLFGCDAVFNENCIVIGETEGPARRQRRPVDYQAFISRARNRTRTVFRSLKYDGQTLYAFRTITINCTSSSEDNAPRGKSRDTCSRAHNRTIRCDRSLIMILRGGLLHRLHCNGRKKKATRIILLIIAF